MLRWTAASSFLVSVAVAQWAVADHLPLVVGDVVVRTVILGPATAALVTVLALAAAATELAAQEVGSTPGSRRWWVRVPVNLGKAALLVAGWSAACVSCLLGLGAGDPRLLDPPSPAGCRVLVAERAYGSSVHLLPPGAYRALPVGDARGGAGHAPISLGSFALTWTGESADLVLRGAAPGYGTPVPSERMTLDCSSAVRASG